MDNCYVPVLRWRPAERGALGALSGRARTVTAPLIELLPDEKPSNPKKLGTSVAKSIIGTWGRRTAYLDATQLSSSEDYSVLLRTIAGRLAEHSSLVIPVVSLTSQPAEVVDSLRVIARRHGLCLRLIPRDHVDVLLLKRVQDFFVQMALRPSDVDLVIDFQLIDENLRMYGTATALERQFSWRTVTYTGGSFPPDLSKLKRNDQHELPRLEWLAWKAARKATSGQIRFGDYTIQHPFRTAAPRVPNYSASIRYTSEEHWVIMRGEGVLNPSGPGHKQYPGQAELLCGRNEFCGPAFSVGDAYIYGMAKQSAGSGNGRTWIQAGINHHMTFAAAQVSQLLAA